MTGVIPRRIVIVIALISNGLGLLLNLLAVSFFGDCFSAESCSRFYSPRDAQSIELSVGLVIVVCLLWLWNGSPLAAALLLAASAIATAWAGLLNPTTIWLSVILQAPAILSASRCSSRPS